MGETMSRIWLTDDLDQVDVPRGDDALWIFPDGHPHVSGGVLSLFPLVHSVNEKTVSVFMKAPAQYLKSMKYIILVNLVSGITTPSNRVKTGQWFTDPLDGIERYSIDDKLFIVDPWRMWWHFGCAGIWFNECNTSFTLEGKWLRYIEGKEQNPCTKEALLQYGKGVIKAPAPFTFSSVDIQTIEMSADVHTGYLREKESAFSEETTINAIIARLSKYAQMVWPARLVPSFRSMFSSGSINVVSTDLGVDQYLVSAIRARIDLLQFASEEFKK
jgi:hypothetical protein